ncbi:MAG: DUF4912 domain-containing protein [Nitrospinaceae bacterium]
MRLEEVQGGVEAKYVLAAPAVHNEAAEVPSQSLPAYYEKTRLELMPRDPYWAYAFWEVMPEEANAALARLGGVWEQVKWVLRMYSPGIGTRDAGSSVFDIPIDPFAPGWYLNLSPPGTTFQGELGLMDKAGDFIALAISHRITLPPDRPSNREDASWRLTPADIKTHYARFPGAEDLTPWDPAAGDAAAWDPARGEPGPGPDASADPVGSRPNPFHR